MSDENEPSGASTGSALALAIRFHEAYERLAPRFGYQTRMDTRNFDPQSQNGRLMVAVCREIIEQNGKVEQPRTKGFTMTEERCKGSAPTLGSHSLRCIAFDCFGTLFDMSGIPREQIAGYVRHVRRNDFSPYEFPQAWWDLRAHQDVEEGMRRLQGHRLCCVALSNGDVDLIESLAAASGFAFDCIVDLAYHGVYKPHRDAYLTVEKDTAFKPHETIMVTANPTFGDIEGAASVGMRSQVIRHGYPNTVIELAEMIGA